VRRLRVREDLISRSLIAYIHCNEVKHKVGNRVVGLGLRTSYAELASGRSTLCDTDAVLARFGGREAFAHYHRQYKHRRLAVLHRYDEERAFGYTKPRPREAWAA